MLRLKNDSWSSVRLGSWSSNSFVYLGGGNKSLEWNDHSKRARAWSSLVLLGEAHLNRLPWPGTIVTVCMSCFRTRGPGKEHGTNKPPPTGRVWERSKGDITRPTTSRNPLWHTSWLNKACTTKKDSESEWLAEDNPETNPITIKPETASLVVELFSWVPLPSCSLTRHLFPIKSPGLSARVSPRIIHFQVSDKSPVSGPGRGPPSCNSSCFSLALELSHPHPWERLTPLLPLGWGKVTGNKAS